MKFICTPLAPLSSITDEAERLGLSIHGMGAREQLDAVLQAGCVNTGAAFPLSGEGPSPSYPKAAEADTTEVLGRVSER